MLTQRGIVLILALLMAGCASTAQRKQDMSAVTASGVPQLVISKMEYNQPIDLSDISELSKNKVSDDIVLRYLRFRRTIYALETKDIDQLRTDGVSQPVIDYLLSTPTLYGMDRARQSQINQSTEPVRDPLLNGQAAPRSH